MNDTIKFFESEQTKRKVALNTDPKRFALLSLPTKAELTQLLTDHEQIVVDDLWSNKLSTARADARHLEAFSTTTSGSLKFFSHAAVDRILGGSKIRGLASDVKGLPLNDQAALLEKLRPANRTQFAEVTTTNGLNDLVGEDLVEKFRAVGDVSAFIDLLSASVSTLGHPRQKQTVRSGGAEQAIEVLTMLRARGYVLFPAEFRDWKSTVKWRAATNPAFAGALAALMNRVSAYLKSPTSNTMATLGQVGVLMTSMVELDDLSGPLIDELEQTLHGIVVRPGHARTAAQGFRSMWNQAHPDLAFIQTRTPPPGKPVEELRTSGEFLWIGKANPSMSAWVAPLAEFVAARPANSKQPVIADLNIVCDFLLSLDAPPSAPEFLVRQVHIYDATRENRNTLMDALEKSKLNAKRRNRVLGYFREFYGWYQDWLLNRGQRPTADALLNPLAKHDSFEQSSSPGQTFRTALPGWLLRDLKATLTANDFAFLREGSRTDWVNVHDNQTGKVVSVWWPGTAVVLTLLLELPLRSHQSRWLDSGEFDEHFYDPEAGENVRNHNKRAIPGRREAFVRQLNDTLRQERWPGMFVNTNKTSMWDGRSPVGYEIPYLTEEMTKLLWSVKKWNLRYLPPLAGLVTYKEESHGKRLRQTDTTKLPKVAPLFRDPSSPQKNRPPSYTKVAAVWLRVLAETEARIKRERNIDLQLTERNGSGQLVWKYDLHTLRVSGISAMIENGVPLEVVSQFVAGHATLVMTLWYLKNSPGKLREAIAKAQEQAAADSDFVGGAAFLENIEKLSPFLLSKNAIHRSNGEDVAISALKQHTGLWTIASDGICPGTSCSTGGEIEDGGKAHGPVPGGRRCGLCRYWITGPAFMMGQVAEANNLIYMVRKKGLELKEARDQLIDYEDSGRVGPARQVRSRIELLERELELDLTEWQKRYAFAMASSDLLEDYVRARASMSGTENLPAAMLTASSADELKVTLQEADDFVLLEHVTQMCEFMPGFKNREATLEKHKLLSKIMVDNGLSPLLMTMNPKQAEFAGNLMSSMLLQYVEAQDRARLLSGEMRLDDVPGLKGELRELAASLNNEILPSATRKLIPIMRGE